MTPARGGPSTTNVGGIPVAVTDPRAAVVWALKVTNGEEAKPSGGVRFVNAYCISLASVDTDYQKLLSGSGLNFPDGFPVAWTARRAGHAAHQVRGPGFFEDLIQAGLGQGVRHYFFGTNVDTLAELDRELRQRWPGIEIAGMSAPPFGQVEDIVTTDAIDAIAATSPDVVWIGLGAPKQDYVAEALDARLGGPLCFGVGAAFDFVAGTQPVAPLLFRKIGLEWLFRLFTEPRRLWRRYLFGNTRFLWIAAKTINRRGV